MTINLTRCESLASACGGFVFGWSCAIAQVSEILTTNGEPDTRSDSNQPLANDVSAGHGSLPVAAAIRKIVRLTNDTPQDIDNLLQEIVDLLPHATGHPELTCARIRLGHGESFTSASAGDRQSCDWSQAVAFEVPGMVDGIIESGTLDARGGTGVGNAARLDDVRCLLEAAGDLLGSCFRRWHERQALLASEERFHTMLEKLPNIAVQGYDMDGTIRYWNKASERFYGYSAQEALGKNMLDLIIPPEMQLEVKSELRRVATEGGDIPAGELSLLRKDGSRIDVLSNHAVVSRPGHPTELFCIDLDLTDRKRLEKQFLRAQRLESIGTLAGGIAHDLNNLLAPIVMGVDLLGELVTDEMAGEVIDNIGRSARRGTDLVKQVLAFARGVEGERALTDLRAVLGEIQHIIHNTFPKDIRLLANIPSSLPRVMADATQLNQVLLNICLNARDAMIGGGQLTLRADLLEVDEHYAALDRGEVAGRYVRIEIGDTGTGIPPNLVERVFEPFFTTKAPGQGTGLGLSTAMGIIRGHGGFITVDSEVGKGSCFRIHLPALDDASSVEHPNRNTNVPAQRGNGELILVVDDESSVLDITRRTLESFGYQVITAEDGAVGIARYAEHRGRIELVLTDMMMPVMDGAALVSALRRINADVPVIVASGYTPDVMDRQAEESGARYFLAKPFTAEQLMNAVRRALEDRAAGK